MNILDFFGITRYFKILYKKDLFKITDKYDYHIEEIKIFKDDKIICIDNKGEILIINIFDKKI